MKQVKLTVINNGTIADNVVRTVLEGDVSAITKPGQFINLRVGDNFLRRPISVCDVDTASHTVTILYKIVGKGTEQMASWKHGEETDVLTGLGNGFDISKAGDAPLLIGGGIGSAPMMMLARCLIEDGVRPTVVLGFNTAGEIILREDLYDLGCDVFVATADGSFGYKGFVTGLVEDPSALGIEYSYFYACGPSPMLHAVYKATRVEGELSFEERMGCGFGACMGCSIQTRNGSRRVCKDGPVFLKSELLWE